jgi:hypothetical protein
MKSKTMNGWMDSRSLGWIDGWTERVLGRWMENRIMNGWMDGWKVKL